MLPLYERLNGSKPIFRIPFGRVAFAVLSLPLGGFCFCILWSLFYHFERATATHCDIPNFLPSISAAIGNYEPQKTVWRLAILLHLPARLAVARMYYHYYRDTIRRSRRLIAAIACLLNIAEDIALMSLSLWNSTDNYPIHRNSFAVFIACSEAYMLITYFLNRHGRKVALLPLEDKSLKYKRNFFLINLLAIVLAGYCFMRHNKYCEPGVYSYFAYFQICFAGANVLFRATSALDLQNCYLMCDLSKGLTFHHVKSKYREYNQTI